jgi:ubiquitin-protein ligase
MADINRIKDEMNKLKNSKYISIRKTERINNNDLEWKVVFDGPEETPYEDGIFTIKFKFPNNYPTGGPEGIFVS